MLTSCFCLYCCFTHMFVFSIDAVNTVQSMLFKILPFFGYMDYFHCAIYMTVCVFSVELMVWFALLLGSIIVLYDYMMLTWACYCLIFCHSYVCFLYRRCNYGIFQCYLRVCHCHCIIYIPICVSSMMHVVYMYKCSCIAHVVEKIILFRLFIVIIS
jgi:hypothetical protein